VSSRAAKNSVLLVEDDRPLRNTLATFLERLGHHVYQAENGEQALAELAAHPVAAMLCDIRMTGMSGIELLPKALADDPDLAVIMLTGVEDPAAAIACLKRGAADYLIKPVDLEELEHALRSALRHRELEIERRQMERWLSREVAVRTRELEEQSRQLSELSVDVLTALVDALEANSPSLRGHSQRVTELAERIASRLGAGDDERERIRTAARLCNVGKLALREPGLTLGGGPPGSEAATGQDDPDLAFRLLEPLVHLKGVAEIVRHQHERYDGQGIPDGRRGEEIPLGSRILAAANRYDELARPGPDGATLEPSQAIASLRALEGLMLDPAVLAALEQEVSGAR
jgi:putative two-component system response regulator